MEINLLHLAQIFESNNISAYVVADKKAALQKAIELIPPNATVCFAGSETIRQIGLRDHVCQSPQTYKLIDPYEPSLTPAESFERRRQTLLGDVMITGTNAVTLKGELVNLDGSGNRVAGLAFGPKRVIIVVGVNKIVKNEALAKKRIMTIAAPLNNKHLGRDNPCVKTGKCQNCGLPTRICRIWSVINGCGVPNRMHIILVNEPLGY